MKKNILMVAVFLIGIGIGCGGYFCVNQFINQKKDNPIENKNPNDKDQKNEVEDLDIHSSIVRKLASDLMIGEYIWSKGISLQSIRKEEKILVANLSAEYKNFLGYRQLGISKFHIEQCDSFQRVFQSDEGPYCGKAAGGTFDSDIYNAKVFSEQDLKEEVERIFGLGSYNQVKSFGISFLPNILGETDGKWPNNGFYFDPNTKNYIEISMPSGGTELPLEASIEKATRQNNVVEIVEIVKTPLDEQNELHNTKYKYTFHYENGNYQFESVEVVK